MKHVLVLAAALALGPSAACTPAAPERADTAANAAEGPAADSASSGTGSGAGSADARSLLQLEDQWTTALVRRDGAAFERLLAPGFVYSEDDRMIARDQLIRDVTSGTDTVTAARNEGMEVHDFGPTAVVTGWLIVEGHGAGGPFNRRYRYTDTWARRGGGWQVVAAHDHLVPAGRK